MGTQFRWVTLGAVTIFALMNTECLWITDLTVFFSDLVVAQ